MTMVMEEFVWAIGVGEKGKLHGYAWACGSERYGWVLAPSISELSWEYLSV
jgi:hypothetical protein